VFAYDRLLTTYDTEEDPVVVRKKLAVGVLDPPPPQATKAADANPLDRKDANCMLILL
jgi:hypothetical protein